jgi:hypothetical protein
MYILRQIVYYLNRGIPLEEIIYMPDRYIYWLLICCTLSRFPLAVMQRTKSDTNCEVTI